MIKVPSKNRQYFARVEVKFVDATTYVIFLPENNDVPPYRLENRTSKKIIIKQKVQNDLSFK